MFDRMHPVRRDIAERNKHECAACHFRVREPQLRGFAHHPAAVENVNVNSARSPAHRPLAAAGVFRAPAPREKFLRREPGHDFCHRVVIRPLGRSYRSRFVEAGDRNDLQIAATRYPRKGLAKILPAVTQVRSEGQKAP